MAFTSDKALEVHHPFSMTDVRHVASISCWLVVTARFSGGIVPAHCQGPFLVLSALVEVPLYFLLHSVGSETLS